MKYLLFLLSLPVYAQIDIDDTMPNPIIYIQYEDGTSNCLLFPTETGVKFETTPAKPGETLQQYLSRHWLGTLSEADRERCKALSQKYQPVWVVSDNRGYNRPVYALEGFPETRVEIGRAEPGEPCGDFVKTYSDRITSLTWRKYGQGVTVCKK